MDKRTKELIQRYLEFGKDSRLMSYEFPPWDILSELKRREVRAAIRRFAGTLAGDATVADGSEDVLG